MAERPPIDDRGRLLELDTGVLSVEQVDLILNHLPFDLSFADERDVLRSFSAGPTYEDCDRETIGGSLQACHPVSSLPELKRVLMAFRKGRSEPFEHISNGSNGARLVRWIPVRDSHGAYRGILEVIEDLRRVRGLRGERRLRLW